MEIQVYSDGSAQTADKPGGWASVVLVDGILVKELSGYLESATNNDAELVAAIKGLDYALDYLAHLQGSFPIEYEVTLISDSEIILNWANGTYKFKQAEKLYLYESLQRLVKKLKVKTQWVKGHSGNIFNERCDKLANNARKGITENTEVPKSRAETKIGIKKTGVLCVYYDGVLKVIDLEAGIVENFNRDIHGKRGSLIEIRKEKMR